MKNRLKPVVVGLSGGLGNQMFQYAAGRSLSARLGVSLILDLSWFGGQVDRQYALSKFNINAETCIQLPWLPSQASAIASRLSRRYLPNLMGVPVWREPHFQYASKFSELSGAVYLEGYWQSERYFQSIENCLLQEFVILEELPSSCKMFLDKIIVCDAICIHVRRGDYLSDTEAAKIHGICGIDYYRSAVNEICEGLANPHCFVFSDDPDWVKEYFDVGIPITAVDVNGPNDVHLDLALMKACKHYIIANSSLSWWGAWLSQAHEKKIIAPQKWFLSDSHDLRDICPQSWMRR